MLQCHINWLYFSKKYLKSIKFGKSLLDNNSSCNKSILKILIEKYIIDLDI